MLILSTGLNSVCSIINSFMLLQYSTYLSLCVEVSPSWVSTKPMFTFSINPFAFKSCSTWSYHSLLWSTPKTSFAFVAHQREELPMPHSITTLSDKSIVFIISIQVLTYHGSNIPNALSYLCPKQSSSFIVVLYKRYGNVPAI